jgi:hypothetical protein
MAGNTAEGLKDAIRVDTVELRGHVDAVVQSRACSDAGPFQFAGCDRRNSRQTNPACAITKHVRKALPNLLTAPASALSGAGIAFLSFA